ncbi:MAG: MATE family efflux transporter [Saccharospirillaceae bacterium]|nr:MATE family efflux transporter [Pseudomonadales bacterium]NRB80915.1 MATE family efflux transporter [Saccharospirillaceae bacterium]
MTTQNAPYLQGSIRQHIKRMTLAGGLGMLALFAVDLADLFFISLLGEQELAAAIGFASSIMFFTQSLSIGLSIAVGANVAKYMGAQNMKNAAQMVASGLVVVLFVTGLVTLVTWIYRIELLAALGATGETLVLAAHYLGIILPWFPFLAAGFATSGVMRAKGDAKAALWLTLSGAIVNAVLDPILIFGFDLGLTGAAIASVISRLTIFAYAMYMVIYVYKMLPWPSIKGIKQDLSSLSKIAIPSVLTNLATPVAIAYITMVIAQYGDAAVAANAIISRLQMVAFVGLYALSGVVGTMAAQNWGAKDYTRVRLVLSESVLFVVIYCLISSAMLAALTYPIIYVFQASDQAAQLIKVFTFGLSLAFIFNGITFATNSLFNNLGAAKTSAVFNIAKATIFTIPFVWVGAKIADAPGLMIGQGIGAVIVALMGWYWCKRWINKLEQQG